MPTVNDVRRMVYIVLLAYARDVGRKRRRLKLSAVRTWLSFRTVANATPLRRFGLDPPDFSGLAQVLTTADLCYPLSRTHIGGWRTFGDVVTSVIRKGGPKIDSG